MLLDLFSIEFTPDSHDFGGHSAGYRKRLKKHHDALEILEAEKLAYANELKQQIRDIVNPPDDIPEEAPLSVEAVKAKEPSKSFDYGYLAKLQQQLAQMELELVNIQEQHKREARRMKDEHEISIILAAINHTLH